MNSKPKPDYVCWKCGKESYQQGGVPVCCHCGAKPRKEVR